MADPPRCGYRLQPLLDRLLSVEADDAVGYLWIGRELADRGSVLFRLLKQDPRGLAQITLRQGHGLPQRRARWRGVPGTPLHLSASRLR